MNWKAVLRSDIRQYIIMLIIALVLGIFLSSLVSPEEDNLVVINEEVFGATLKRTLRGFVRLQYLAGVSYPQLYNDPIAKTIAPGSWEMYVTLVDFGATSFAFTVSAKQVGQTYIGHYHMVEGKNEWDEYRPLFKVVSIDEIGNLVLDVYHFDAIFREGP